MDRIFSLKPHLNSSVRFIIHQNTSQKTVTICVICLQGFVNPGQANIRMNRVFIYIFYQDEWCLYFLWLTLGKELLVYFFEAIMNTEIYFTSLSFIPVDKTATRVKLEPKIKTFKCQRKTSVEVPRMRTQYFQFHKPTNENYIRPEGGIYTSVLSIIYLQLGHGPLLIFVAIRYSITVNQP